MMAEHCYKKCESSMAGFFSSKSDLPMTLSFLPALVWSGLAQMNWPE
jgi:hypothetical protein